MMTGKRRIGIVGYGNLGCFLVEKILSSEDLELAFVWNRSPEVFTESGLPELLILDDLDNFSDRQADLIVEVAHPDITKSHGVKFIQEADYLIGSPTALGDDDLHQKLRHNATSHALYVPSGAFWGAQDISKMADRGTLKALKISMTKHPTCFRLHSDLQQKLSHTHRVVLYEGPVRSLCHLAPNNVNTMAAAAIAGHNLGFDGVQSTLISDPGMSDYHMVEVDVSGPGQAGRKFHVHTSRLNPANLGVVTGEATYNSFYSSLLGAAGHGPGVHLC